MRLNYKNIEIHTQFGSVILLIALKRNTLDSMIAVCVSECVCHV